MVEVSDVFAQEQIEWRGRKLTVARPSFITEGLYRAYLEREAYSGVARNRDVMGESVYRDALAAVNRDVACKAFAWGTPECARSLEAEENTKYFFLLIFSQAGIDGKPSPNDGLTLDQMDEIWRERQREIAAAWQRVSSPNAKTPPTQDRPAASKSTATNSAPSSGGSSDTPST
jgi:hypothetical protein